MKKVFIFFFVFSSAFSLTACSVNENEVTQASNVEYSNTETSDTPHFKDEHEKIKFGILFAEVNGSNKLSEEKHKESLISLNQQYEAYLKSESIEIIQKSNYMADFVVLMNSNQYESVKKNKSVLQISNLSTPSVGIPF